MDSLSTAPSATTHVASSAATGAQPLEGEQSAQFIERYSTQNQEVLSWLREVYDHCDDLPGLSEDQMDHMMYSVGKGITADDTKKQRSRKRGMARAIHFKKVTSEADRNRVMEWATMQEQAPPLALQHFLNVGADLPDDEVEISWLLPSLSNKCQSHSTLSTVTCMLAAVSPLKVVAKFEALAESFFGHHRPTKRARLVGPTGTVGERARPSPTVTGTFDSLTLFAKDGAFSGESLIFDFLGPTEYLPIALIANKTLLQAYTVYQEKWWKKRLMSKYPHCYKEKLLRMGTTTFTSFGAVASSLDRTEQFWNHVRLMGEHDWPQQHRLFRNLRLNADPVEPHGPRLLLLQAAARDGHFETFKWMAQQKQIPFFSNYDDRSQGLVSRLAAENKHFHLLQWASENGFLFDEFTTRASAESGDLKTLKWLHHTQHCPISTETCAEASARGDLPMVTWCIEEGLECDEHLCTLAARNNHLDVLAFALGKDCPRDGDEIIDNAIENSNLEMLKLAQDHGCTLKESHFYKAVKNGNLHIVKWLVEQECPWQKHLICPKAAENGHVHVLKWARLQRCGWDASTCRLAAEKGHLGAFKFARKYGCPIDEHAIELAAENGHLDIIKFAIKEGFPNDVNICKHAAKNGHLKVLQWAQTQGGSWGNGGETCLAAALNGHLDVLRWAIQNGCPRPTQHVPDRRYSMEALELLYGEAAA